MYVCIYIYICMYVYMYVCIYIYIYIIIIIVRDFFFIRIYIHNNYKNIREMSSNLICDAANLINCRI